MNYTETTTRISMADGVTLFARLWLPEAEPGAKVPAVFEYIPYRTDDIYRAADDFWGDALARHGIAFVRVDVRGSGNSTGLLTDEYTEQEIDDGVAVIAWLAQKSWCNGRVGMRGISWGAINALLIASRKPAALQAIMPIAGTDNRFTDDAHFIGGLIGHNGLQWATLFKLFIAGPPDPAIVGDDWLSQWQQRLRNTPPVLARWLRARADPASWRPLNLQRIRVPAYFVTGWQDPYARPTWRMYQQFEAPKKLLIGPWGHTYPYFATPFGLAWVAEEVAWWQSWLVEQRAPDGPGVRLFVPHETIRQSAAEPMRGHWLIDKSTPVTKARTYYLTGGTLSERSVRQSAVMATLTDEHIVGQTKPEWLDRPPLEQSYDDELSHTWDSPPLESSLTCCGVGEVALAVQSSSPFFSVAVRLCEVTPDNRSWLVADAVHRFEQAGEQVVSVALQLGAFAHQFNPGSRIRVSISQSLWPLVYPLGHRFTVDLHSGAVTLPVTEMAARELDLPAFERAADIVQYDVVPPDENGKLTLAVTPSPTTNRIRQAGNREVLVGRDGKQHSEVIQMQPQTSRWTQASEMSWSRDGWRCVVKSGYELQGDVDDLHVREWVRAEHNGALIFEQEEAAEISRDEST